MTTNLRSEDTGSLLVRQELNQGAGKLDLAKFISEHAAFSVDSKVLDVGAGVGEPILSCLSLAGIRHYWALDCSESSLVRLESAASARGLTVSTVHAEMDALTEDAFRQDLAAFSHITAVYSLYYSPEPCTLIAGLRKRLRADGSFLVVGPAPGNNHEWFAFLSSAGVTLSEKLRAVSERFFPNVLQPVADGTFLQSSAFDAQNVVTLTSLDALESYWRSNIYYDARFDAAIRQAGLAFFQRQPTFEITKRIRLLRAQGSR